MKCIIKQKEKQLNINIQSNIQVQNQNYKLNNIKTIFVLSTMQHHSNINKKNPTKTRAQFFNQTFFAPDYSSLEQIVKTIPHLVSLIQNQQIIPNKCRGLVIRSGNDDNIHKAIKYGVWTTTQKNKYKLEQYWRQFQQKGIETYLFFSAVKSGHFEGVARLASGYNEQTFPLWWQNQHDKFKGHFEIEWIFVKDITYRYFAGLVNTDDEDLIKSKDCDQLNQQTTKKVIQIYKKYNKNKSIFSSFQFFDGRQKSQLRGILTQQQRMWIINEQYKQLQMQQYMLANYQAQQNLYINPNINQTMNQTQKQVKPNTMLNNPGFQMNPISKHKKNYKQK